MLEHITDHAKRALARLIEKLKRKPKIEATLNAFNDQNQAIEDAYWQLFSERSIETSIGDQLDILGKIVGERRDGSNDDDYRLRIRARIRANLSNGTTEDIYRVFRALLGPMAGSAVFTWFDSYPARFVLTITGILIPTAQVPIFARFLYDSKAGGVGAHFGSQPIPDDEAFTFAISAFLTVAASSGDTVLTVDSTVNFPATGTLIVDDGTPVREVVTYTATTPTSFTISALVNNHEVRTAASLDPSPGKGWGDDTNPATGGAFVSAVDVEI
jgi:hypothetical protein